MIYMPELSVLIIMEFLHACMQMLGLCKDPDGQGVFSVHEEAMQISTVTVLGGSQKVRIDENENDQLKMRIKQLENLLVKYEVWYNLPKKMTKLSSINMQKMKGVGMKNESTTSDSVENMTSTQEKNEAVVQQMITAGLEPHT